MDAKQERQGLQRDFEDLRTEYARLSDIQGTYERAIEHVIFILGKIPELRVREVQGVCEEAQQALRQLLGQPEEP